MALALLVLATPLTGCGGKASTLVWEEEPDHFQPEALPDDRIAYGEVRNASLREINVDVENLELRDASGTVVESTAQFAGAYARTVYPPATRPDPLPDAERSRLRYVIQLQPGEVSPLTVSYRLPHGAELPIQAFYEDFPAFEMPQDAVVIGPGGVVEGG